MSQSSKYRIAATTLVTDSTSELFIPASDWFGTSGITAARGWLEMRARTGLLVSMGVQTANDPRSPDAGTQVKISGGDGNGFANANGVFDPDTTTTSLTLAGKKFMRVGFVVKVASGTGFARVSGTVELFF